MKRSASQRDAELKTLAVTGGEGRKSTHDMSVLINTSASLKQSYPGLSFTTQATSRRKEKKAKSWIKETPTIKEGEKEGSSRLT